MKTTGIILAAALAAALILSGCSAEASDNSGQEDTVSESSVTGSSEAEITNSGVSGVPETEWSEITLDFPSGKDEVTDYNKDIFSVNRFMTDISIPSGWKVKYDCPPETAYLNVGVFSLRYIYDENDNCIGAIGYNVIPDLSNEELKIPAAVYNQIALGNGYQFNVRNRYNIVQSSDICETALTDVYYSDSFNNGNGEKINKGIVMQDTSAGVYIAAEFENDAVTDEQHKKIGESLKITISETDPEETEPSQTTAEVIPEPETDIRLENDVSALENSVESDISIDINEAMDMINANSKTVGNDTCGYITVYSGSEYEENENGGYTVTSDLSSISVFLIEDLQVDPDMTAYMICLTAAMNAEIDGYETYNVGDFKVDGMKGSVAVMADKDTDLGFMMYASVVDSDNKTLRCISYTGKEYTMENLIAASWIFDNYSRTSPDN